MEPRDELVDEAVDRGVEAVLKGETILLVGDELAGATS